MSRFFAVKRSVGLSSLAAVISCVSFALPSVPLAAPPAVVPAAPTTIRPAESAAVDLYIESKQYLAAARQLKGTDRDPCHDRERQCKGSRGGSKGLKCSMCFALQSEEIVCGEPTDANTCTLHTALDQCTSKTAFGGNNHPFAMPYVTAAAHALDTARGNKRRLAAAVNELLPPLAHATPDFWTKVHTQLEWLSELSTGCFHNSDEKARIRILISDTKALTDDIVELHGKLAAAEQARVAEETARRLERERRRRLAAVAGTIAVGMVGAGLLGRSSELSADKAHLVHPYIWTIAGGALTTLSIAASAALIGNKHRDPTRILNIEADKVRSWAMGASATCVLTTAFAGALWIYAPRVWARHNEPDELQKATTAFNGAAVLTATSGLCWTVAGSLWRESKFATPTNGNRAALRARTRLGASVYPAGLSLRFSF
jgi:hypothetical protein